MANWTLASEISLPELIPNVKSDPAFEFLGVPFFSCPYPYGTDPAPRRNCAPMGWLETNVVQFTDPDHYWFDPTGRTFHSWMRAHIGGTGYAMVLKVIENADGSLTSLPELAPSGKKKLFVPCPGGQLKFHVRFDSVTRLLWLVSNQATDRPTRATICRITNATGWRCTFQKIWWTGVSSEWWRLARRQKPRGIIQPYSSTATICTFLVAQAMNGRPMRTTGI